MQVMASRDASFDRWLHVRAEHTPPEVLQVLGLPATATGLHHFMLELKTTIASEKETELINETDWKPNVIDATWSLSAKQVNPQSECILGCTVLLEWLRVSCIFLGRASAVKTRSTCGPSWRSGQRRHEPTHFITLRVPYDRALTLPPLEALQAFIAQAKDAGLVLVAVTSLDFEACAEIADLLKPDMQYVSI